MLSRFTFSIFFNFALFLFFAEAVFATTVFSPIVELEAEPGQTQAGIVKVYNETAETIFLHASVESFTTGDDPGQPVYLPAEEGGVHLAWFSISQDDLTLQSGQIAVVPFEVEIPEDAVPGGYYSVIFWASAPNPEEGASKVSIGSKVGTLVFLKVKGDLVEEATIEDFKVKPDALFFEFPVNFSFKFLNAGNIHLAPSGSVEIVNWLGFKQSIAVNSARKNVLPNSSRVMETVWGQTNSRGVVQKFIDQIKFELGNLPFGKNTATLNITYGVDEIKSVQGVTTFWFFPVRSLILLTLLLLLLGFIFRINMKVKKLKKTIKKNDEFSGKK